MVDQLKNVDHELTAIRHELHPTAATAQPPSAASRRSDQKLRMGLQEQLEVDWTPVDQQDKEKVTGVGAKRRARKQRANQRARASSSPIVPPLRRTPVARRTGRQVCENPRAPSARESCRTLSPRCFPRAAPHVQCSTATSLSGTHRA